ncbi:MAG: RidA family protein [Sporocytophaga sp.]|nr:RidA family protein [Sporocytophaga sp.]
MEKIITNPWSWQDARSYVQAVEVKNVDSTLYISGQTAINDQGISSNEDMRNQLIQTIENLELVIQRANFEVNNIVRLNIYTTSTSELFENFDIFQSWVEKKRN